MSKEINNEAAIFEKTFRDILSGDKKDKVTYDTKMPLGEALMGGSENESTPLDEETLSAINQEYIPPSIGDQEWEEFVSREPLPPLDRLDEARAVAIGIQEIRRQKEYLIYINSAMINECSKHYVTYNILCSKDIEEYLGEAQKKAVQLWEDMEHLITGDFDKIEAAKSDFRLYQVFEEKRLSVLHDILEHYNKKRK